MAWSKGLVQVQNEVVLWSEKTRDKVFTEFSNKNRICKGIELYVICGHETLTTSTRTEEEGVPRDVGRCLRLD